MSEIVLVRQHPDELTEDEKAIVRRFLFGQIDGLGEKGKRQWRRFWNRMFKLEPGEMVELHTYQQRIGWYHRKHMKLEQTLFESQERFEEFETFRAWVKVGSGFVDWYPGPKGGVIPVPKSISYSKLEQSEMEQFHNDAIAFLRTEHAGKTLWKHLAQAQRIEMLEQILERFGGW